jgi:hypothetical protein
MEKKSWADTADEEDEYEQCGEDDWSVVEGTKKPISKRPNCNSCGKICDNYTLSESNYGFFKPLCIACSEQSTTEPTDTFMLKCSKCSGKSKLMMTKIAQNSFTIICLSCYNLKNKPIKTVQEKKSSRINRQLPLNQPNPVTVSSNKFGFLPDEE